MIKFFKRSELVRKGMSCGKSRRRRPSNEVARLLEASPIAKLGVLALFLFALIALISWNGGQDTGRRILIALLVLATAVSQLWINHPLTFARNSRVLLILGVIFVQLLATKWLLVLWDTDPAWRPFAYLIIPGALAPLTLSVLLGCNHGLYAATFGSLWSALLLYNVDALLLIIGLISGFVAVYVTLQVRRRSRLVRAGIYVGVATWMLSMAFGLIGPILPQTESATDWSLVGMQTLAVVGAGVLTATFVGGILPMIESTFGITTDISWLEAADLNHPLLTQMSLRAPGTYYHSMAVAQLAEAAAERIGANDTICRVASYFHDIGKLVKPEYFAENIIQERNPHDDLTPTMSALIILAHVKEGVDLALKHRLNQTIVDVIQQHHGTSLVSYFYQRSLQQQEDARRGGKITNMREEDIPVVREESFRYSGPKPQSRESAVISLADSVESASRSLRHPTPQKIEQMVESIVSQRIADRQLDECDLTLAEIWEVAESFKSTLASMLHRRIAYIPEPDEPPDASVKPTHKSEAEISAG